MKETAEIRWFWESSGPSEVVRWFAAGEDTIQQEERTDNYLLLPDCETVGIKLREDRFEVKALIGKEQNICPKTAPEGVLQRWTKWSLTSDRLPAMIEEITETGTWQAVTKNRLQRQLEILPGPTAERQGREKAAEAGCSVELTYLGNRHQLPCWMTLAFEACGLPSEAWKSLETAVERFWQDMGPPPGVLLSIADSFSYPAWLNRQQ